MSESSALNSSLSRKCQSEILRALASVGQKTVGEVLVKSETWVSRWKSEDLKTCGDLLAALNLKVVPAENVCYPRDYVEKLQYFAKRGIELAPPELDWKDDE